MSKFLFTVVASGLMLAGAAGAYADDVNYAAQQGSVAARTARPPVQVTPSARRFYSYQPPAVRGQRVVTPPYIRPASAKALGNY